MTHRISRIFIHPLKSGAALEVRTARVGELGLAGDRRWMVVDRAGRPLTQREAPGLCRVRPALPDGGRDQAGGDAGSGFETGIVLRPPRREALRIRAPGSDAPRLTTELWGAAVRGRDAGEEAARWLEAVLGVPCRLLHLPDTWGRPASTGVDPAPEVPIAFTDGYPVHFFSGASLDGLNRRLEDSVGAERFRPSFVVTAEVPHEEDGWRRLRIGDVILHIVKACPRCSIPAVDPETGVREPEPNRSLARYRRHAGKVWFGQNAVHQGRGRIAVGDRVEVLERGPPRPPLGPGDPAG